MARRKIRPPIMKVFGNQFVDEPLDEQMARMAQRDDIAAIRWVRETPGHQWQRTPYGMLDVRACIHPGWCVIRDRATLVHARSPREALFTSVAAAKAAGLIHLADGFGGSSPMQDGLWWKIDRPASKHVVAPPPVEVPLGPSVSDDHTWGRQRLEQLLKQSGVGATAEDENLIIDLQVRTSGWQLPPPAWIMRAQGCFELDTPYGTLVVRRLIGWTVERDGAPLVSFLGGDRVIFDKLENAKMSALVHAADIGTGGFPDGTRWSKPSEEPIVGNCEAPNQSRVEEGSNVVVG
jgi:hypothetical protein